MKFLYIFLFSFLLFFILFNLSTLPYSNPYTLTMIFGKKGSGKTTTMVKLAYAAHKRGMPVYSNVPLPGCYLIDDDDIGFFQIPPGSVLLIDEVGMIWDNRNFKSFKPEVRDWFKLQRHHKVKVYLFSQTFDIDKKLRDLTDDMYLIQRKFRIFAYGKRIIKRMVLTEATADAPSRIDENLKFDSILFFWAGSRTLTFIPRWASSFDSFAVPELEEKEYFFNENDFQPDRFSRCLYDLALNVYGAFSNLHKRGEGREVSSAPDPALMEQDPAPRRSIFSVLRSKCPVKVHKWDDLDDEDDDDEYRVLLPGADD